MKLYAEITNSKGRKGAGSDEWLDIDVFVGNAKLASFTVRRGEIPENEGEGWVLYDDDEPIYWIADKANKQTA